MKKIISGVIALTLLVSLGLAGASCVPIVQAKTGTIGVRVTDAPPGYNVTGIEVTVSEVEVHKEVAGEGEWTPLTITGPNPFDLIKIRDKEQELVTQDIDTARYTQIRMTVEMVEVTYSEDGDGEAKTVEATIPSGELKFVRPFDVIEGGTTTLIIDFDADKAVVFTGADKVIFKPVVKLLIEYEEHASAPMAIFDPTSGPVGTSLDVTGTGWVASEVITSVEVGGEAATHTLTVVDGNLSGTITVPDVAAGDKDIVITGETSGEQTFADAFEVTPVTPMAIFTPTSGPVTTVITVTGTGWVASEAITSVEVGGEAATHTLTVVDGNLSGTITVPDGLDSGPYSIVIEGENSGTQTFPDAFTVPT